MSRNLDMDEYGRPGWYRSWYNMLSRCYAKSHEAYPNYGGRGITVCDEWRHNSAAFGRWALSHGWRPGLYLDRIDNDKGYYPENCRWLTPAQSNRNRSCCRYITIGGVKGTLSQWAAFAGIHPSTLASRLNAGWDVQKAVNTPVAPRA